MELDSDAFALRRRSAPSLYAEICRDQDLWTEFERWLEEDGARDCVMNFENTLAAVEYLLATHDPDGMQLLVTCLGESFPPRAYEKTVMPVIRPFVALGSHDHMSQAARKDWERVVPWLLKLRELCLIELDLAVDRMKWTTSAAKAAGLGHGVRLVIVSPEGAVDERTVEVEEITEALKQDGHASAANRLTAAILRGQVFKLDEHCTVDSTGLGVPHVTVSFLLLGGVLAEWNMSSMSHATGTGQPVPYSGFEDLLIVGRTHHCASLVRLVGSSGTILIAT